MNQETQGLSKQQIKSRETRAKIFQAAKRILQKQGYEQLSIKNICEEAGVSNGSFYHHFKTKDDLLSYYIEEQPSMDPDLLELPSSAAETKEAIISVYLNYVHYCEELGVEFMANYYTPKGNNINKIGIKPDIEVSLDNNLLNKTREEITHEEDNQLQEAIKAVEKEK